MSNMSKKHYAIMMHGAIQTHIYCLFDEDRMDDVLRVFLPANVAIWSDFHFKYDKDGSKRAAYKACAAQGNWRGAFEAIRKCAFGVSNDVTEVREASYDPKRFEHTLTFFRDGLGQCEWISFQDDLAKLDENKTEE